MKILRPTRRRMTALGDALTVGILLTIVFGAVTFYLYSRLTQNEKRVGLLENLLLSLKLNTEAELEGPSSVQPVSGPAPLDEEDVDGVEETHYSELLRGLGSSEAKRPSTPPASPSASSQIGKSTEEEASALLQSLDTTAPVGTATPVDVNYESMTLKELQALGKERGLPVTGKRKPEVIDLLKKQGGAVASAPVPLESSSEEGPAGPTEGFELNLEA